MPWLWRAMRKLQSPSDSIIEEGIDEAVLLGSAAVPKLIRIVMLGGHADKQQHPNWRTIQGAIQALRRIGDLRAVDVLIDALNDRDRDVSNAAEEALAAFDTAEARQALKALRQHDQRVIDENVYFIRGIRPDKERWLAEAMYVANRLYRDYRSNLWAAWILPGTSQAITCEVPPYDKPYLDQRKSDETASKMNPQSEEEQEQWALHVVTSEVTHLREFYIDPMPSKSVPFFIASVPNRVPSTYWVSVRLNIQNWSEYPDVQKLQSALFWNFPIPTDEPTVQLLRKVTPRHSPEPGQDLCVHVNNGDREITGVLRLQDRLDGERNSSSQKFQATLYLSDTVLGLLPGTPVMRALGWWELRTANSAEIVVATILEAELLMEV